jgi:peptide-methionine (R)-S-oxide reductase
MQVTIYSLERGGPVTVDKVEKADDAWRAELPGDTYLVARHHGTEPPFDNAFWDNHAPGVYRCACCGTDLFSSETKFESGTGWPSFSAPIADENVI